MKFIQIGDTHVGYRQYGIRGREGDFQSAFSRLCELAIRQKVDAAVFTGDTFETVRPTVADINFVREQVGRMKAAGIEVIGIEGNHDATGGEIIKAIDVEPLGSKTVKGIKFHGINFCSNFEEHLSGVPEDTDVLVMHQTLNEIAELFGDVSADAIVKAVPNLRYVSLGHIHNPSTIARTTSEGKECFFTYNGSTEMNEISESQQKTVPIVTITKTGTPAKTALYDLEARKVHKIALTTEEEISEFRRNIKDYRDSLVYVVSDTSVTKMISAILKEATEHGILYTLSTVSKSSTIDLTKVKTWERSRSTVDLKKIIQEDFGERSAEQSVVSGLLDTPDNMKTIIEEHTDAIRQEADDNPGERVLQPGSSPDGEIPTGELREGTGEPAAEATDDIEDEGLIC